jgi:serine/threonine protein kinase
MLLFLIFCNVFGSDVDILRQNLKRNKIELEEVQKNYQKSLENLTRGEKFLKLVSEQTGKMLPFEPNPSPAERSAETITSRIAAIRTQESVDFQVRLVDLRDQLKTLFKHPLDVQYAAVMITPDEIENLEKRELKKRKQEDAEAVWGALGSTKFVKSNSGGDFFVQKSLKDMDQMTKREKNNKMKKLSHEKDMYEKLKDVEGILKIFPELSSNESIAMESMSMDAFSVFEYLLETKKKISNELLRNFLKLLMPLAEMHERGITHNDIAIENIMCKNGDWKFIDFDGAKENLEYSLDLGHVDYWSPAHQMKYSYRKHFDVFPKFGKIEGIANAKKEDVYGLGIAALMLVAPESFGKKMFANNLGAFKPLITFLKEKNQVTCGRTLKDIENKFKWEEYHQWLSDLMPEIYDPEFKNLITNMLHPDSEKRISAKAAARMLKEITKH